MSEKLAEVFEQYDIEMIGTRKGRGATILTTTEGLFILEPFRGNMNRLEQEHVLKQLFLQEGYHNIDYCIPNRDGMLFTCDKYRQPFVMKKHFDGEECDMHNMEDMIRAVKELAILHTYGQKVAKKYFRAWKENQSQKEKDRLEEIRFALENGEELEKLAYLYDINPVVLEETLRASAEEESSCDLSETGEPHHFESVLDVFFRHNKELKKIHRYIIKVKRKSAFENLFLQVYPKYYQQGVLCVERMKEKQMESEEPFLGHYGICHGSYNHHNVLLTEEQVAIVHFENFSKGNQLGDLYQFARKAMEKNHYNFQLLNELIDTYHHIIPLSKEDYQYLFVLFSYPEKFWKIANRYYNAKKSFLSPKYTEKLENVILQETEKDNMLKEYFSFHLG